MGRKKKNVKGAKVIDLAVERAKRERWVPTVDELREFVIADAKSRLAPDDAEHFEKMMRAAGDSPDALAGVLAWVESRNAQEQQG